MEIEDELPADFVPLLTAEEQTIKRYEDLIHNLTWHLVVLKNQEAGLTVERICEFLEYLQKQLLEATKWRMDYDPPALNESERT